MINLFYKDILDLLLQPNFVGMCYRKPSKKVANI